MEKLKEKLKEEPVAIAAAIAAVLGVALSLVGLEVENETLAEWSGAAVAVISGIVYVVSALVARRNVMPVERVEPESDAWWPKNFGKRQALLREFFKRYKPEEK
jgi:hypothetical protein